MIYIIIIIIIYIYRKHIYISFAKNTGCSQSFDVYNYSDIATVAFRAQVLGAVEDGAMV